MSGAMERLEALQRKQLEQARQLQLEQWEREKTERRERQEERQRQAEAEKQQALERQKSLQLAQEEQRRRAGVTGSGFLVAPGYVATNAHVVQDFPYVTVRTRSGQNFAATVIAKDEAHDLALLHVAIKSGGLVIRPAATVKKGESVYAIGYPVLQLQGSESKITEGIISSFSGMQNNDQLFQISVPVQHGNSGGPLLNKQGEVVGVIVAQANAAAWLRQGADLPQNVNYAVKPDLLLTMMQQNGIKPTPAKGKQKQPLDHADQNTLLVIAKGEADMQALPAPQHTETTAEPAPRIAKTEPPPQPAVSSRKPVKAATITEKAIDQSPPFAEGAKPKPEELNYASKDTGLVNSARQNYKNALTAIDNTNYELAIKLLNTAIEQGYVPAATTLGMLYDRGLGVAADEVQALHWFRYAADRGQGRAQAQLGHYYSMGKGGLERNDKNAIFWFQMSADSGDPVEQTNLGLAYNSDSYGVARNEMQARELFQKAADRKNGRAMFELGRLYGMGGGGLEKDEVKAAQLFRQGAEAGDPIAQIALGSYYDQGLGGLPLNHMLGRDWLVKAANQENATALYMLGMRYLNGDYIYEKSQPVAVSYLVRARKLGHPQATSILQTLQVK